MSNRRHTILALGLLAALVMAWWAGHLAAGGPSAMPQMLDKSTKATPHSPVLPAPKITATQPSHEAIPSPPTTNPLLEKVLKMGSSTLTLEQLQSYLRLNHRDAESLITASRLTGDLALLREAAQRFPNDPRVQFDLAMRSDSATERQQAIEALAAAAPDNAMGSYLAANSAFKSGNTDEAVHRLMEAASRLSLDDFTKTSVQAAEDAYLAAGFLPLEAKAAAMFGLPIPQGSTLRELGRQMADLAKSYAERGDAESAAALSNMGIELGQRIQDSLGGLLISDLIGQSVESQFLKGLDPNAVLDRNGLTVQQRLDQIAARKDLIKTTIRSADPTNASLSPQLLGQYLDRQKALGELAALQWLRAKLEAQDNPLKKP